MQIQEEGIPLSKISQSALKINQRINQNGNLMNK